MPEAVSGTDRATHRDRDDELATLRAFRGELTTAPGALVLNGEPGVGKTAMWRAGVEAAKEMSIRIKIGGQPVAVAGGAGSVWVADQTGGTVVRIDPATDAVIGEPIPVGPDGARPHALAFSDGAAWVVDQSANAVDRIGAPH